MNKKAVVIHSGGMDSSICLALAVKELGPSNVIALSFDYGQRHKEELKRAQIICDHFNVQRRQINLDFLSTITTNALIDRTQEIIPAQGATPPSTMILGRNGLMARIASIYAYSAGIKTVYMGVIGVDTSNSGYRDCSREYMDLKEKILRMDFDDNDFTIRTPIIAMNKKETMDLAYKLGVLEFLLEQTISCYNGVGKQGCMTCPSCKLRNEGILEFRKEHPDFWIDYFKFL